MSSEYPLKHERLSQLYKAGFNVADFACWAPGQLNPAELKRFLKKHKKISCRHFHSDEKKHFKCPVAYDQTDFETILAFCSEHNKTFYTLCNEAIRLEDSICAGNILILNEETYFIEYFYGPGTPRDIESKGPAELKIYNRTVGQPSEGEPPPEQILKMAFNARKFKALENKAYILEFSLYPYPIGRNQSNTICWEWRWGWLHYQLQANQYLLQQLKNAQDRIRVLERELNSSQEDPILEFSGRSFPV